LLSAENCRVGLGVRALEVITSSNKTTPVGSRGTIIKICHEKDEKENKDIVAVSIEWGQKEKFVINHHRLYRMALEKH
jgi:hypothetical protein